MAAFLDRIKTRASDSMQEYPEAQKYLTGERKLLVQSLEEYKIGYTTALTVRSDGSPEFEEIRRETRDFKGLQKRILFPITNCIGGTVGFSTRRLVDEFGEDGKKFPRYRTYMSPEAKVSGAFFGIEQAMESMLKKGFVYVTEGAVDCMSLATVFPNTVSSLTSMLTDPQMWTLSMFVDKVILVFDSDGPGKFGAEKAIERFGSKKVKSMSLGYHDANTALTSLGYSKFKSYAEAKLRFINFKV